MSSAKRPACSPYSNDQYTVGWICALPIEMAAAKGMTDEEHGDPQTPPPHTDQNTYLLGCIGKLKVVVACLPKDEIGFSSAAVAARDMLSTFPNIKVGLLVGIGAGIPDYESDHIQDIRLGDVVISSDKESGGVVLYDFGKRLGDGSFKSMYALDRPPRALRTALSQLEAEHQTRENKISRYINQMLEKYPYMRKKGFIYPGQSADQLFQADYRHESGRSCATCDPSKRIDRHPGIRPDTDPVIHYGVIATGSSVIKHAPTREELRQNHRAICLEMEAAGLMNNFPCIVIRGISDYADSHKNDQWQPYAAATAAACAKELLEYVQPRVLEREPTAKDIFDQVIDSLSTIGEDMSKMSTIVDTDRKTKILTWLTSINYTSQQSDLIDRQQKGTGQWLLGSEEFQKWLNQSKQTLFCPGIPGAGKTMISSIVVDHLSARFKNNAGVGIAYIYCSYQPQQEQKPKDLLSSLLKQLVQKQQVMSPNIMNLYESHRAEGTFLSFDEIIKAFRSIVQLYSRVFIMIDGLDEYYSSNKEAFNELLSDVFSIQKEAQVNLFVTSRFVSDIISWFSGCIWKEIRAQREDILCYINGRMHQILRSQISKYPEVQDMVRSKVVEAADGMFLLARLLIDSLRSQPTAGDLKQALENLPQKLKDLDETYEQAMRRIEDQETNYQEIARKVLCWITHAKRALSTTEIQHALAVRKGSAGLNEDFLPDIELLDSICAGLITVDQKSDIIRLVHHTTQEYFKRTHWFPNAEKDIAVASVTYLSYDVFATGFCTTDEELEARLQKNALYDYAARHWAHHVGAASIEADDLILTFLKSEAKVAASSQAMLASRDYDGYSQRVPKYMIGVHLAACFGLREATIALLEDGYYPDLKDTHGWTPLSWAARNGHQSIVKLLLTIDEVDPDSLANNEQTPLSLAAENGHELVVKLLLATNRVNPDSLDINGQTPLSLAAENGREEVVKLLLGTHRVGLNSKDDKYGQTPLFWALENRHEVVVKLLLSIDGVDPNSKNDGGQTPLSWALENGYETGVMLLLSIDGIDLQTPLRWAIENGHEEAIELLLSTDNIDVNSKDSSGQTPLWWALKNRHTAVINLLLNTKNIDVTSKNKYGQTPLLWALENGFGAAAKLLLRVDSTDPQTLLWWAVENGHESALKLLLSANKIDVNSENTDRQTPLWCALENGHERLVKLLLEKGADLELKNKYGVTPLLWAAENGHEVVMKLLLEKGANLECSDNSYCCWTPLWRAVTNKQMVVMKLLLENGADPDCRDRDGRTPLLWASENGYEVLVKLLLENGADPDPVDRDGQIPLSYAAQHKNKALVMLLLESGANPDSRDDCGRTPLSYAAACGDAAVVKLLLENGADPDSQDYGGHTPVSYATANSYAAVAMLLEKSAENANNVTSS